MYLQLIITTRNDDGTLDHAHQRAKRFERFPVVIGGDDAADLVVPGLPARALLIAAPVNREAPFTLGELAADATVTRHHQPLAAGDAIRNGDELELPDGAHLRVVVGFQDTRQRGHIQVVAGIAVVGVVLVMIAQIVYMFAVNRETDVDTVLATELQRQKVYHRIDVLRSDLERQLASEAWATDLERGMTGRVISDELERLAFHLREHGDQMSMAQLDESYDDLERLYGVYLAMASGTFGPDTPTVDTEAAIGAIIAKDRP